jgi:hypothetical protein
MIHRDECPFRFIDMCLASQKKKDAVRQPSRKGKVRGRGCCCTRF